MHSAPSRVIRMGRLAAVLLVAAAAALSPGAADARRGDITDGTIRLVSSGSSQDNGAGTAANARQRSWSYDLTWHARQDTVTGKFSEIERETYAGGCFSYEETNWTGSSRRGPIEDRRLVMSDTSGHWDLDFNFRLRDAAQTQFTRGGQSTDPNETCVQDTDTGQTHWLIRGEVSRVGLGFIRGRSRRLAPSNDTVTQQNFWWSYQEPAGPLFAPSAGPATLTIDLTVDPGSRGPEPVIRSARATRTTLTASQGTTFRYSVSTDARVVFMIERRSGRRFKRVGSLAQTASRGANSKRFSGRLGARRLASGTYRARLVATNEAGNHSAAKFVAFRVV